MESTGVDSVLNDIGYGKFQRVTLLLSGLGFGKFKTIYQSNLRSLQSLVGAATVELVCLSQIKPAIQDEWNLKLDQLGWMSTVTFLGEIFGGLFWGYLSDRNGREKTFLMTSMLMAVFSVLPAFVNYYSIYCVLRFLLGFGIGGGLAVDFIYFIECLPSTKRSFRTCFIILVGICGLIYSAVMGMIFIKEYNWRVFTIMCALPSIVLAFGRLYWRYESPKFLVAKGKIEEARQVLMEIARINGSTVKSIPIDLCLTESAVDKHQTNNQMNRKTITKIVIASVIFFCQTSAYYGLTLWIHFLMRKPDNSIILSSSAVLFLAGLAELPGLLLTALLVTKFKVKKWLLCGNFVLAAGCSFVLSEFGEVSWLPVFCFMYFCIVSIWTIIYVYIPESFPVTIRSRAFGIAGTFGKVGGLLSPFVFGKLLQRGFSIFFINSVIAGLFAVGAVAALMFTD